MFFEGFPGIFPGLFGLMWIAWIVLGALALFRLRTQAISDIARAVWAVVILMVPVFGALAYFIVEERRTA